MQVQAFPVLRREKMSTVDTAWLRMDSSANLMMIVSVLMFDQPLDRARFRQVMASRFLTYRRFRSRVVQDLAGAWWQEQAVDLDQHIVQLDLQSDLANNKAELEQLVSDLSATPLNASRPLWQMHLVDNCIGADGRTRQAVIIRIHHCIADGIALVGVLLSMFDDTPVAEAVPAVSQTVEQADDNPWLQLLNPITRTTISAINVSTTMATKYLWMLAESNKLAAKIVDMGHMTTQLTHDAVKLMTMADDSKTRLKGKPGGVKHVAWSEPLPLSEIKAVGQALGSSINDVLMSSVAGAIGSYLRAKGDHVPFDSDVRAMVPVNLRKSSRVQKLGNAFGLVPLVLPVGIEDPMARLHEVRRRMDELKGGYQALVAMAVLGVLGATPKQVQGEIQTYFSKKATAVMSNVPGPQSPL